jgi:hypothetical protein
MGLRFESPLACSINMRGGARGVYTSTRHHVKTLATISSQPNPETLVAHEVLAHSCTMFHPSKCGLCGGAATVVSVLIGYSGARSLQGRGHGGGDRLLPLHRRTSILDCCSNSSSVALRF